MTDAAATSALLPLAFLLGAILVALGMIWDRLGVAIEVLKQIRHTLSVSKNEPTP